MTEDRLKRLLSKCRGMVVAEFARHGLPETCQDDLVQEMALALFRQGGDKTDAYYLRRAMWAGVRWLRRTRRTRTTARTFTVPNVVNLIDGGHCLRVWC